MRQFHLYQVFPDIPESLRFLEDLGMNFWWTWKRTAAELFRRIDPIVWEESGRNPIVFLTRIPQQRLKQMSKDYSFLAHLKEVEEDFNLHVRKNLIKPDYPIGTNETIAYFSMEFGIHESLPIFAGGLGVAGGDHLKSASDMGIPLTGVGLLFRRGYFRQILSPEGMQQEDYVDIDYHHLPITRALNPDGQDVRIQVYGPDGIIHAMVWKVNVGRIPLFLLDTDLSENSPDVRNITTNLYSGDAKNRLSQEVLLGIGGMKALHALGIYPKVCHMNEGHCAFCGIERLSQINYKYGVDFKTALEIVPRITVFTTHTPVAAGHDEFDPELVLPVFKPYAEQFDLPAEEILALGQINGPDKKQPLSMFILGMHLSQYRNGVSELHGQTARHMWAHVWPNVPIDEIPISHITNGIHISSFISPEFTVLFDRYLGPDWYMGGCMAQNIDRIDNIPDEELWWAHELNRTRLLKFCRNRMESRFKRYNAPIQNIETTDTVLGNDVLTIGFAKPFAGYKRADLLLKDPSRLSALLNSVERPVQFIFAGKAHPKDHQGKEVIRQIISFAAGTRANNRIVFLEDYDMQAARYIVQGVDGWLNTPRRPFEACGTSGMKAAINGAVNIGILDGWWNEAYTEEAGWAIGHGEVYTDAHYQDMIESEALYNVLENGVIPEFYSRKNGDFPAAWVTRMKASMKLVMSRFCSMKMITAYERRFYSVAAIRHDQLIAEKAGEAGDIARRADRYRKLWNRVKIGLPEKERSGVFRVGENFRIVSRVHLGELLPEEVNVEVYYGPIRLLESNESGIGEQMSLRKDLGRGDYIYEYDMSCAESGRFGFTLRVKPRGDERLQLTPHMITWA